MHALDKLELELLELKTVPWYRRQLLRDPGNLSLSSVRRLLLLLLPRHTTNPSLMSDKRRQLGLHVFTDNGRS